MSNQAVADEMLAGLETRIKEMLEQPLQFGHQRLAA